MRPLCLSLALMATPLLLGVAPAEAAAQGFRAPMIPRQPMMPPSQAATFPRMPMLAPQAALIPRMPMLPPLSASLPRMPTQLPAALTTPMFPPGMPMPHPGLFSSLPPAIAASFAYQMPYGLSGMYATPYVGYITYPVPSSVNSPYSLSTSTPAETSPPALAAAGDVEVSGPLNTPPPRRALIRVRLPRTWADVAVNGRNVDAMGKTRTYVTPELAGATTFVVTATWQDNGRPTQLQGQVTVNAGQTGTVDFTAGK